MVEELLDPRRAVVFAGDSVSDCGRRTDPQAWAAATTAAGHRLLAEMWRSTVS